MQIKPLCSILFTLSLLTQINAFADDTPRNGNQTTEVDSTALGPIHGYTTSKDHSLMLKNGTTSVFCGFETSAYGSGRTGEQCNIPVTGSTPVNANDRCPPDFSPKVVVVPISVDRNPNHTVVCSMRGYEVDQPSIVDNIWGGYNLVFTKAYSDVVDCGDRAVNISFTIFCVGNN